jgi:hypothetical protein
VNWLAEMLLGFPESRHQATVDLVGLTYSTMDEFYDVPDDPARPLPDAA